MSSSTDDDNQYEPIAPWQAIHRRFLDCYGQRDSLPAMFQGSLKEALQHASETSKLLIIYLHCQYHQDTDRFVENTLMAPEIIRCLDSDFIFFIDYFTEVEAYVLSGQLEVEAFPFLAVVHAHPDRVDNMIVHAKINGYIDGVQLLTRLHAVHNDFNYAFITRQSEEAQRAQSRSLRDEQDREYNEALEKDRQRLEALEKDRELEQERMRLEQERQEAQRQMEKEKEQKLEEDRQRRRLLLLNLPPEPSSTAQNAISIQVRLINGTRLQRRFQSEDAVEDIYNFVLGSDDSLVAGGFDLVSNYPRIVYQQSSHSLIQANIPSQCVLFIQERNRT